MMEPEFLTVEDVLLIHEEQIEAFGGIRGVRDQGLLESAVIMPQASFGGEYLHQNIFEMAPLTAFTSRRISRPSTGTSEPRWAPLSFFSR